MLFIYNSHDTPRIDYALDFVFRECFGMAWTSVESLDEVPAGGALLAYGYNKPEQPSVWIFPHDIMLEFVMSPLEIGVFEFNGHPVFFGIENQPADLPYDPFALIFFMLSRYEEYFPKETDRHGRFPARQSEAWKWDILEYPVVDQAVSDIRQLIRQKWPDLAMKPPEFEVELTYDIDAPFAHYGKGLIKNAAGGMLDLLTGRGTRRLLNIAGKKNDPFDIFDELLGGLDARGLRARFFILLEHRGRHNPSIDYRDSRFRALVDRLAERQSAGLHPSYHCHNEGKLKEEMARFRELTGSDAEHSRFHFIRLKFPETYLMITDAGIWHDHSMGFPDHIGFRAGTCRSYRYYDISAEIPTDLVIHPFCLMDATFAYYQPELSQDEILARITVMTDRVKQAGGKITWVFHNDLLSTYPPRQNWSDLHKMALEMAHK